MRKIRLSYSTPNAGVFALGIFVLLAVFLLFGRRMERQLRSSDENPLSPSQVAQGHTPEKKAEPLILLEPESTYILASATAPLISSPSKEVVSTANGEVTINDQSGIKGNREKTEVVSQESYLIYVVRPHDTITGIAHRQLRSVQRWREIARLNEAVLPNPNLLTPGMRLRLPVVLEENTSGKPDFFQTYTIKEGDSLQILAERFYGDRDRWKPILDANRAVITDRTKLQAGITITIPRQ